MRYLLFAGENRYPEGGVQDLMGQYETVDDAKKDYNDVTDIDDHSSSWATIVDKNDMKIVWYMDDTGLWEKQP